MWRVIRLSAVGYCRLNSQLAAEITNPDLKSFAGGREDAINSLILYKDEKVLALNAASYYSPMIRTGGTFPNAG
jgi:hypothetical protein